MIRSLLSTLALAGLMVPTAHAAFITGTVDFTGTAGINGTGPLDATTFSSFTGTTVRFGTGAYSGTAGTPASFQPLTFNPPTPLDHAWSFTIGSITYSFDLVTLVKDFQGQPLDGPGLGDIRVSGTGIAHITGYEDTPGSFVLHASGGLSDLEMAFGATAVGLPPGVPDSGSTLVLVGAALGGVASLRRRLV